MPVVARATALTKVYGREPAQVVALNAVDLEVTQGEFTAIMGPSGSGKSTLMHLMTGLDAPTTGSVMLGGDDIFSLNDNQLTELRRDRGKSAWRGRGVPAEIHAGKIGLINSANVVSRHD